MPQLIVKLGDQVVQKHSFDKDLIVIGRAIDNDVVIDNLAISRRHAQIAKEEKKYILSDLKSANGTYVNGERIFNRVLKNNDVIALGKHKIYFIEDVRFNEMPKSREFDFDRTIIVAQPEPCFLIVKQGKADKMSFKLDKAEIYIGRDPESDVVVSDWLLAKRHSKLTRTGKNYSISDLGTWKGTKVNSELIKGDRILFHKDLIEIGSTQLQFLVSDEEELEVPGVALTGPMELTENITAESFTQEAGDRASAPTNIPVNPRLISGEYLASASSPIFHFADCNWAKGITEPNRIYFVSVGDAILSRRRSCHTCQPGMQNKDIEFWLKLLHDPDNSVRRHAAANLKKLTGKDYTNEL